jgi:hypothetical protein
VGVALIGLSGPGSAQTTTTYYHEDFSNKSFGNLIYYNDFDTGYDGWTHPKSGVNHEGRIASRSWGIRDSALRESISFYGSGADGSIEPEYSTRQITNEGVIYIWIKGSMKGEGYSMRGNRVIFSNLFSDSFEAKNGTNRYQKRLQGSPYSPDEQSLEIKQEIEFTSSADSDNPATAIYEMEYIRIVRGVDRTGQRWEADDFTIYTDSGIDGQTLYGRDFTGSLNASPAHESNGTTTIQFDIQTGDAPASWRLRQLGTDLVSGTIQPNQQRTVKKEINLQDPEFELHFDSNAEIGIDNLRVVGTPDTGPGNGGIGSGGSLAPSAGPLSSADGLQGRNWATNLFNNLFELVFLTLQWGSLIAVVAGVGLWGYSKNQLRNTRGHALLVGGVVGLVLTLGFPMVASTVGWLATGDTDTRSLDNPDYEAVSVQYSEDFENAATLSNTGWRPTGGGAGTYLDTEQSDQELKLESDGAEVKRTIPIDRGEAVPGARLKLEAAVQSSTGSQPPDHDALNVTIVDGTGDTLVDDELLIDARGGDLNEATATRQFGLDSSNVTIKLKAVDLNGGDSSVDIAVDDIEVQTSATA